MARRVATHQTMANKTTVKRNGNNSLDEILKKSAKLMAKQGYHGTSMRDLAETTGHSLSGLYHYLESKDELLFKINKRGFTSLLETAKSILEQDISPADKLEAVISNHIGFFSTHLSEMRVMMFGTHDIDRKRSQIISELKDEYASIVRHVVNGYVNSRSAKQFADPEISRKTYLLFGMMNWIYGWYSKNEHGSANELASDIYETFTKGCLG
jgi:TetR/AcrR family transcriptional regulator, cholesterol catabolism regulator